MQFPLFVETLDLADDEVEVEVAHRGSQNLCGLLRPAVLKVVFFDGNEGAVFVGAHAAASLASLQHLFVAEDGPLLQLLERIANLTCCFPDLPLLAVNRKPEVVVNLNAGLHDKPATPHDVDCGSVGGKVVDDLTRLFGDLD